MGELLFNVGDYLLGSAFNRVLTGAGLTLGTASVSVVVIQDLIDHTRQNLSGISDFGMAFIDLSGLDVALSLSISAILTRLAIERTMVFLSTGTGDGTSE